MSFTRLALAADIADNKSLAVTHNDQKLLICHSGGVYYTVANRCSHAEEPLECGRIRHGWLACPVHGARFDLETGEAMNPPAKDPIATFPTLVVDGWVEADLP